MKRAALYIRVSTQEQAVEGYSIGAQKERLIAYCKAHDWAITDFYVDPGRSGSNLDRPGIQRLTEEIDKFDVVLVYKLDRLSRSQRDTLHLIEDIFLPHNVDFVSMQESFDTATPFGKAMIGLLAVFAQLEREQIKERTKMGKLERAKAGLHHGGGNVVTGYDYVNGKLEINLYEAAHVKMMYEMYLSGKTLYGISESMRLAGIVNRNGNPYEWTSIRNILRNPTYLGHLHYSGVVVENTHEPIITDDDFQAVQVLMKKRTRAAGSRNRVEYLLTGLLHCGHCGNRYHRRNTSQGYSYYSCYSRSKANRRMIKDPNCKNKHWKCAELESIVEAKVREVLKSPELAAELATSQKAKPEPSNKQASTEKRIKELDKKIAKLMELYQSDTIPANVLGDSINKLYAEKTALEATLEPDNPSAKVMPFNLAEELMKDAAQIWDFADEQQKRRILLSLINKIILNDEKVDIEWSF